MNSYVKSIGTKALSAFAIVSGFQLDNIGQVDYYNSLGLAPSWTLGQLLSVVALQWQAATRAVMDQFFLSLWDPMTRILGKTWCQ